MSSALKPGGSGAPGVGDRVAAGQARALLRMLAELAPHARRTDLPARIETAIKGEPGAGSRDRKLYREILYTWVRCLPWMEARSPSEALALAATLAAETPATSRFRIAHALPILPPDLDASLLLPDWFRQECPEAFSPPLNEVLLRRAPLWLRARPSRLDEISAEFDRLGWQYQQGGLLPGLLRMDSDRDLTRTDSFSRGCFEVQDLGSQLVLEAQAPLHEGHWLDVCAGAGGKTLQLAGLLGPQSRIDALDVRPAALDELLLRARRAGLDASRQSSSRICAGTRRSQSYDGILVDAPCSGTGTWRRAPHLKWSCSPGFVKGCAVKQRALLEAQVPFLKPGSLLVYATCSLCRSENEAIVEDFLTKHPGFSLVPPRPELRLAHGVFGTRILPHFHDTDGFFVATLRSPRTI